MRKVISWTISFHHNGHFHDCLKRKFYNIQLRHVDSFRYLQVTDKNRTCKATMFRK